MKRICFLLITVFILLMTNCSDKKEFREEPADLIPRNEMIDIVVDAWFMESAIHNVVTDGRKLEPTTVTLYKKFFEDHNITREQFIQSIEYYTGENKASENFIRECVQRLEERQEELTGVAAPASQPQ
jgi:hypothetical protein